MSAADLQVPAGAPDEVVTKSVVRTVDLQAFGFKGSLALITLDNGEDHNRPNTFGPASLASLDAAITEAIAQKPSAIAVTGKPFIFAAGADLSALSFLTTLYKPFLLMVRIASEESFNVTHLSSSARKNFFVCKFGKKRRFVLIFECETLFPVIGRFPVT